LLRRKHPARSVAMRNKAAVCRCGRARRNIAAEFTCGRRLCKNPCLCYTSAW
jgi:hypothetical protein